MSTHTEILTEESQSDTWRSTFPRVSIIPGKYLFAGNSSFPFYWLVVVDNEKWWKLSWRVGAMSNSNFVMKAKYDITPSWIETTQELITLLCG